MSDQSLPPTGLDELKMTDQTVQRAWDKFAATDAVDDVDGGVHHEKHHRRIRPNHTAPST